MNAKCEKTINDLKNDAPNYYDEGTVRVAKGNLSITNEDGVIDNPLPKTAYEKYLSSDAYTITNHTRSRHSKVAIERMRQIKNGENYTVLNVQINSVHSGSYGRLCWNEQASTITTRFDTPAGGRFIHPDEDRTLTPREAARVQSYPDDYFFRGAYTKTYMQIGNSVPPLLGRAIAQVIKGYMKGGNA